MRRYLFGPVTAAFADQNLYQHRQAGQCLAFDAAGGTDLRIEPGDSWESVTARLPDGWRPDFIVLYLPYTSIPACLWSAPVPIVGLAADWNLLWHHYRHCLRRCDLVLADMPGVEVMMREGIGQARAANLFGLEREALAIEGAQEMGTGTSKTRSQSAADAPEMGTGTSKTRSQSPADAPEMGTGTSKIRSQSPFRDIDILFIGNMHGAVQRERLAWLGRLARLGQRWRVAIHTGVFGEEYWRLMRRARIVFNRSVRGECNKRVFEAALVGAMLMQESESREVREYLRGVEEASESQPGFCLGNRVSAEKTCEDKNPVSKAETGLPTVPECVFYREDNLEELLEYYLEHEDERRAIAEAARERVKEFGFERLWEKQLMMIEREWAGMVERAEVRCEAIHRVKNANRMNAGTTNDVTNDLMARVWAALASGEGNDRELARNLAGALVVTPHAAGLHSALGFIERPGNPQSAAGYFKRALECDPGDVMAGLNLAEALVGGGDKQAGIEQARMTLAVSENHGLHRQHGSDYPCCRCDPWLDSPHYPPGFDFFRVEWERAAWSNAGRPGDEARAKRVLIRWRLQLLLAELTGDVVHAHEAVLARPDLPVSRAFLGLNLLRAGRAAESIDHLVQAVSANPFDEQAARLLFQAYGAAGRGVDQRRLARERRLLLKAAPQLVAQEAWITDCPPVGDELASIIILCCNGLEYTRQCLESVLRHTRPPYELVLVDNGSTDGTGEYLEGIRSRAQEGRGTRSVETNLTNHGTSPWDSARRTGRVETNLTNHGTSPWDSTKRPVRVVVIRNETNLGFPAGCNQGIKQARGRYVVFLNNDTIVTEGWLEGLITWSLFDWPKAGMVGPVTNHSRAPQQIDVDYRELSSLAAFAARRRREHAGKGQQVERLTGFCLLVRREVLNKVGGFDERYGIGYFDDDDLCVAARQAGFLLLVAEDVFVHHFGNKTFQALGVDCSQQLHSNFEQFKAKWGAEHAAGYRLPERSVVSSPSSVVKDQDTQVVGAELWTTDHGLRTKVSLCMIVKNEEENLPSCLASVADLVDEIIIVDTGSTDTTKEIAARFGARVFDFQWVDSFAAARNECLKHATGAWIFWMDADDRLDEGNRHKLRALFASLRDDNAAYSMKCLCLPDPVHGTATMVDHVRLFRNHPDIRWQYRVHEQILPAIRRLRAEIRWADVVIQHCGYLDPALRRKKSERDLRLLQLENSEKPDDPFTLFNLGLVIQDQGQTREALAFLQRSLERSEAGDSIVRKLYATIAQCQRQLGEREQALAACRKGREHYPEDCELLFQEGLVLLETGDKAGAERYFVRVLERRDEPHFGSMDLGIQGYKSRHNLAALCRDQGRLAEAEAQWLAALKEQPAFVPGWLELGELWIQQARWSEVEQAAARLNGSSDGAVLRARACLARKEYEAAKALLRETIERAPNALAPRVVLSYALLQEGRDLVAAERALRDVLTLDSGHPEARRNLSILLRELGRAS